MFIVISFPISISLKYGIYCLKISKLFVCIWNDHGIRNLFISLLLVYYGNINTVVTLVVEYTYFASNALFINHMY